MVEKVVFDVDKIATRARELALDHAKSVKNLVVGNIDSWRDVTIIFLTLNEAVIEEAIKQSKKT